MMNSQMRGISSKEVIPLSAKSTSFSDSSSDLAFNGILAFAWPFDRALSVQLRHDPDRVISTASLRTDDDGWDPKLKNLDFALTCSSNSGRRMAEIKPIGWPSLLTACFLSFSLFNLFFAFYFFRLVVRGSIVRSRSQNRWIERKTGQKKFFRD